MTGHTKEWPTFTEKYPIKTRSLDHSGAADMLNHMLENDIRNSGQGALSAAKCYRTQLNAIALTGECTSSTILFNG